MSGLQIYAFFILPLIMVGLGLIAMLLNKWYLDRAERRERQERGGS
jgi:hypothetical protein